VRKVLPFQNMISLFVAALTDWPFPRRGAWKLHYNGATEFDDGRLAPYEAEVELDRFLRVS